MLLRTKTVVHLTVALGRREAAFINRLLTQLPGLNSLLASGLENRIHFGSERFSLFLELAHLIFHGFCGVALVHLHAIRAGRLTFTEALQVRDLFLDRGQLGLKSCELFAQGGDHLRTGRFRGRALPGRAIPFIAHLRNRAPADVSQVVVGPDLFGFLWFFARWSRRL